jgi:hypothetical protein
LVLRRRHPLIKRGRARIFLVLSCFQLLNTRVDRGQARPDLLAAALRRP